MKILPSEFTATFNTNQAIQPLTVFKGIKFWIKKDNAYIYSYLLEFSRLVCFQPGCIPDTRFFKHCSY